MKSSASKIQMTDFNDLFRTGDDVGSDAERVQHVPLTELHPFKGHPFQVRDDEAMQKTVESIAESGVHVPGIVRPRPEGGYEMQATGVSVGVSWQVRIPCPYWFVIWTMMRPSLLWWTATFSAK